MNGLQSLPQWKDYFHDPSDSQLGLLNAIQVSDVMLQFAPLLIPYA